MLSRRMAGAGRLVLLAGLLCAPPALALTPEEAINQAKVIRLRVFGVLESVHLQPADRATLEKDKTDLDRALKSKDKALLESLITRTTADLARVASGNLQAVRERYLADATLLEKLRQPAIRPLVPKEGPRIDRLLADKSRILVSQETGVVVAAQKGAEESRTAATGEMRASVESLSAGALRLAKGNERVLAEKVRGFRPAVDAARQSAGSKDLAKMIAAAGTLVGLLPDAKSAIGAALVPAGEQWGRAESEAKALQERFAGDLQLIESGRGIGEALGGGTAALAGGQADALREAADRLGALVRKVPGEVEQRRTALLAERDAKVKGAEAQLGPGGGEIKPQTRTALQSAAARAAELRADASLATLATALQVLEGALKAVRAEASAAFKQALLVEGKARACLTGLESGLDDLLPPAARESLDRCLEQMKSQADSGSAAGLQQAADGCQALCSETAAGVCKTLEDDARLAARLATEGSLPREIKAGLAAGAGLLPPGAAQKDCRSIDRGGLSRLRRDVARAQIALALQGAYSSFSSGPEGLEKAIESLDKVPVAENQKARSPLLQWSLAYFYYLKYRTLAGRPESDRWLEQARGAFQRAGSVARAELASSGLFPDDFVTAMAAGGPDGS